MRPLASRYMKFSLHFKMFLKPRGNSIVPSYYVYHCSDYMNNKGQICTLARSIQGLCVESLLPCTRWWPDTSHSGRGGENNLPHSFFPKLWFRQQPLGVTVALASNDRQGQGRAGARAVGHVVLAAHLDPNRIVSELWLA